MKINRFIAGALALCLAGAALPVSENGVSGFSLSAYAEEEYTEGTYGVLSYKNYGDYIEISSLTGSTADGEIKIPSEIDGVSVTSIGKEAFSYNLSLTSVEIPDSITSIGESAFSYCPNLTSIDVSENNLYYSSIDGILFNKNKAELIYYPAGSTETEYIIPDSVTSIGNYAFHYCSSLTSIEIPNSVTSIGDWAFYKCSSLTSITIPDSITSIGDYAFDKCTSLTSIDVSENNPNYSSVDGVFFNKDKTELIQYPASSTVTEYIIPDSVTSIGNYAFSACICLTSIEIPDSVISIGDYAFSACSSLTSIEIPNKVSSIGDNAFSLCTNLTSIEIPDSVTSIGYGAFFKCSNLTEIIIENPECEINDDENTISATATIYGYENSTAQAYAEKYGRNFVIIGEDPTATELLPGDADGNDKVEIADAVKIMCYVTDSENTSMTAEEIEAADVYQTGDGLSVQDALSIQKYLAQIITELPEK